MEATKLTKKQERILEVLADECERNPKTSLTGLNIRTLGAKVGEYPHIGVMYDVWDLFHAGFVSRKDERVIITQQGLNYVKSHKKRTLNFRFVHSKILTGIVVGVVSGLIVLFISKGCLTW